MPRSLIERRLFDLSQRLRSARDELAVADEQLAALEEQAEEARVQALVSESPMAEREYAEARGHADAMDRSRRSLLATIESLRHDQDQLLDRLLAGDGSV